MRVYWEFAVRGFRRHATYRAATWAGAFTNTIFGFMMAYTLLAVYTQRATVGGMTPSDAVTYVFVGQGLLMTMQVFGSSDVAATVRSGSIATDLFRPIDFQFAWLAQDLGRCAYHLLARGIPPFAVAAFALQLRVPEHPRTIALFLMAVVLGNCVSFACRFIVNLAAFWVLDDRGFGRLYLAVNLLFCGGMVPIAFFPPGLRAVAHALPFWCFMSLPIDVFLERAPAWALPLQGLWAVVLLAAGRYILARASRKLVIQGG